jgi:tetratricopeptide (TPR) repeat protein
LGHYEEALQALDEALALNSQDHQVWRYKGNVLFKMGSKEQAVKLLRPLVEYGGTVSSTFWSRAGRRRSWAAWRGRPGLIPQRRRAGAQ